MFFFLKKLVSALLLPLPVGLALIMAGLVLIGRGRAPSGQRYAWAGLFVLLVFGYVPVAVSLLHGLEAPYRVARPGDGGRPEAVVVLGGGFHHDPSTPANFQLGAISTVRLVEGIRLLRLHPGARLVLSGGRGLAEALADTAEMLGVPRDRMELEAASLDTADEARLLRDSLRGRQFLLVTSASHMRRSMTLFEAQGLTPTAAPADFGGRPEELGPQHLIPAGGALPLADRALHEWLGLLWAALRS